MGKYFILSILLCFLSLVTISAQNTVDKDGRKQGLWVRYDENNVKIYEGTFEDDKPVGEFLRYHANGKLKSKQFFDLATNAVPTELYRENGKLFAKGNFVNMQKEGEWCFYTVGGTLFFKEQYLAGKRTGESILYYEKGSVFELINWKDGELNGKYKRFFPDGALQSELNYVNGKREGKSQSFFDNGKIESEGMFVDNKKEGVWIFNNSDGTPDFEIEYKDGVPLNQAALDEQQQKQLDENDRNAGKLKDPELYMANPEDYMYE